MKRHSKRREAVLRTIRGAEGPLLPAEVHQRAVEVIPGLGIATVYRNLKELETEGLIRAVQHPDRGTCYEQAGLEHHHHFHCNNCDQVFMIPGCPGNLDRVLPDKFVMQGHQVFINGLCSECVEKESRNETA